MCACGCPRAARVCVCAKLLSPSHPFALAGALAWRAPSCVSPLIPPRPRRHLSSSPALRSLAVLARAGQRRTVALIRTSLITTGAQHLSTGFLATCLFLGDTETHGLHLPGRPSPSCCRQGLLQGTRGDGGRPPILPQRRSLQSNRDRTKAVTAASSANANTSSTSPRGPRLPLHCILATTSYGGHAREDPDFNPYLEILRRWVFLQSLLKDLGKLSQKTRILFSLCLVPVPA